MNNLQVKICRGCGIEKPVSEFYGRPERGNGSGLKSPCKSCNVALGRFKDDRYLLSRAIEYLSK